MRLKGGLPTIAVRDMVIQAREGDLVIATFGRGFYVLDDITPLRQAKAGSTDQAAVVFPVKDALLYVERHPLGGPKKGFQGDAFYAAENPPYGAVFTAYLKDKIKTKKEKRQDAEKDAAKKNQTLPYPTHDDLRAEAQEAKPELYFLVYDESGAPIRRVEGGTDSGFQRAAWDLRYPASRVHERAGDEADDDFPDSADLGPLVLSGSYSVRMFSKSRRRGNRNRGSADLQSGDRGVVVDERGRPHGAGGISAEGGAAVSGGVWGATDGGECERRG